MGSIGSLYEYKPLDKVRNCPSHDKLAHDHHLFTLTCPISCRSTNVLLCICIPHPHFLQLGSHNLVPHLLPNNRPLNLTHQDKRRIGHLAKHPMNAVQGRPLERIVHIQVPDQLVEPMLEHIVADFQLPLGLEFGGVADALRKECARVGKEIARRRGRLVAEVWSGKVDELG
ncbi:hypothetical protein BCR44DRAFT_196213 [Catenaria anguillulae PL171]|uniref:Uncharacterized protein n=1 Tax=Catenaria anguillulae PL171 TaxID=765915 RepID=A0A1Y2HMG4_9FUNG|nr:hypothetical protein BCR44DRAFT_196213 [Catenaria anguillulae PL171]